MVRTSQIAIIQIFRASFFFFSKILGLFAIIRVFQSPAVYYILQVVLIRGIIQGLYQMNPNVSRLISFKITAIVLLLISGKTLVVRKSITTFYFILIEVCFCYKYQ